MTPITRRQAIAASAAIPLAAMAPHRAAAQAPMFGPGIPPFYRVTLGGFEVTALLAGTRAMANPHEIFGLNAGAEEFAALAEANFVPADRSRNFFTPTLVNTGSDLVLFDTGLSAEGIGTALATAGVTPDLITLVVLTHMHGDHIGGLMGPDGTPFFPNAAYVTGRAEYDHWAALGNEGFDTNVRPLAEKMRFLEDGEAAAPGITALLAPGHTPGHMAYMLESDGQRMALTADTCNHYVFSLMRPDWEVRFDSDMAMGAATRRKVFDMIAADHIPFIGYHMPFPALGYAEAAGDGYRFVPHSYQLMPGE
jgi:glyoxylase-like metal-dependent hydrolase (beta-lactamase superfamily II)